MNLKMYYPTLSSNDLLYNQSKLQLGIFKFQGSSQSACRAPSNHLFMNYQGKSTFCSRISIYFIEPKEKQTGVLFKMTQ